MLYPVPWGGYIQQFRTEGARHSVVVATCKQLLLCCFHLIRPHVKGGHHEYIDDLFAVLLVTWLGGLTVFHVAGGLIHLLLVFAVIPLVLHFVMGARTA